VDVELFADRLELCYQVNPELLGEYGVLREARDQVVGQSMLGGA
jgi:hypothetical protein